MVTVYTKLGDHWKTQRWRRTWKETLVIGTRYLGANPNHDYLAEMQNHLHNYDNVNT